MPPQTLINSSDNSFGRIYSLKEKEAIKRVFNLGEKFKGSCLKIYYYNQQQLPLKIVLKVSKRNGSAPRRNLIKRLIREIVRTNKKLFEPYGNMAIISFINPELENVREMITKDLLDFAGIK